MFEDLYADEAAVQVFLVTGVIGGFAAWATGRALANSWRSFGQAVAYLLLLGAAIRFAALTSCPGSSTIALLPDWA